MLSLYSHIHGLRSHHFQMQNNFWDCIRAKGKRLWVKNETTDHIALTYEQTRRPEQRSTYPSRLATIERKSSQLAQRHSYQPRSFYIPSFLESQRTHSPLKSPPIKRIEDCRQTTRNFCTVLYQSCKTKCCRSMLGFHLATRRRSHAIWYPVHHHSIKAFQPKEDSQNRQSENIRKLVF